MEPGVCNWESSSCYAAHSCSWNDFPQCSPTTRPHRRRSRPRIECRTPAAWRPMMILQSPSPMDPPPNCRCLVPCPGRCQPRQLGWRIPPAFCTAHRSPGNSIFFFRLFIVLLGEEVIKGGHFQILISAQLVPGQNQFRNGKTRS